MNSAQNNAHAILKEQMEAIAQTQQLTEEDLARYFTAKVEDVLTQAPPHRPDDVPPPLISIGKQIYIWKDTHFEAISESAFRRKIVEIARVTLLPLKPDDKEDHREHHPFLKPRFISEAIEWMRMTTAREVGEVNPSGYVNCRNGVLHLIWSNGQLTWELEQHDPNLHLFIEPPGLVYDPDADRTVANKLLECVADNGRRLLLQQLAATLDIEYIRSRGHRIPALMLIGNGANGKDTIGDVIRQLHGRSSLAQISVKDWQSYEGGQGRGRFSVQQLAKARISIASENDSGFKIDKLESLKQAISGEEMYVEEKGIGGNTITPRAVFLFFLNSPPLLDGGGAAILSRYGVIKMPWTYSMNPGIGEKQADARFKHDPEFVATQVLPGLLNILLEELAKLPEEGFNLSSVAIDLQALREETCHLHQMLRDHGYRLDPEGTVTAGGVFTDLQQWYKDEGWMERNKIGEWTFINVGDGDEPVRAARLLPKRLKRLFPSLSIERKDPMTRQKLIGGLSVGTEPTIEPTEVKTDPEPKNEQDEFPF